MKEKSSAIFGGKPHPCKYSPGKNQYTGKVTEGRMITGPRGPTKGNEGGMKRKKK